MFVHRTALEALGTNKPKRGRKRTHESVEKWLLQVKRDISTADPLTRLTLAQERIDLEREIEDRTLGGFDVGAPRAGLHQGSGRMRRSQGHHLCRLA